MNILSHIHTLEEKHNNLKNLVKSESARPLPNFSLIADLKKQKLQLKDEIQRLYLRMPQEASA